MPRDRRDQPLGVLIWYFCQKYRAKQRLASQRASRLRAAYNQTCPRRTKRRWRLQLEWRIAATEAQAAAYMLDGLHRDMPCDSHDDCAAWLCARVGKFDWRTAYMSTLVLVDE